MNAATAIQGRIGMLSMMLALAVASLPSAASAALPPVAAGALTPTITAQVLGACSAQKKAEVLAPATVSITPWITKTTPSVLVDCSLTLAPGDVVTKQLLFEGAKATGATVACNGATIDGSGTWNQDDPRSMVQIYSSPDPVTGGAPWTRPENVALRNCNIIGTVAIWGALGGPASHEPGYVEFMRANAPRNIVFDHVTITGMNCSEKGNKSPAGGNCVPLYIYSGVSYFEMFGSEIKGHTTGTNIYLDAESDHNTFRDNSIHAEGSHPYRELIAIDGSSHNTFVNNIFSSLEDGGIYLYRNCGEGGSVRISTPSHNTIVNNIFYYKKDDGEKPAIFVASRNGWSSKSYDCSDDSAHPVGSGISDFDHAQFNVVMQNQIYKLSVKKMIKVGRPDINKPNYISHNTGGVVEPEIRDAGCYVGSGYKDFIRDGEFINLFRSSTDEPVCRGESRGESRGGAGQVANFVRYNCDNGVLSASSDTSCQVSYVPFECQVTDNNGGCQAKAFCPAGKKIIGGRAACNLEFGAVSSTDVGAVPLDPFGGEITDFIKVVRASDKVAQGSCTLGNMSISSGAAAVGALAWLGTVPFGTASSASFGCRESDSNGGDCHIKGTLYCR